VENSENKKCSLSCSGTKVQQDSSEQAFEVSFEISHLNVKSLRPLPESDFKKTVFLLNHKSFDAQTA
jgi:hypothetical protein